MACYYYNSAVVCVRVLQCFHICIMLMYIILCLYKPTQVSHRCFLNLATDKEGRLRGI